MNFIIYHLGNLKFHFPKLNNKLSMKFTCIICMPKEPVADHIFHFKNSNIPVVH